MLLWFLCEASSAKVGILHLLTVFEKLCRWIKSKSSRIERTPSTRICSILWMRIHTGISLHVIQFHRFSGKNQRAGKLRQMLRQTLRLIQIRQWSYLQHHHLISPSPSHHPTHSQPVRSPSVLLIEIVAARVIQMKKVITCEVSRPNHRRIMKKDRRRSIRLTKLVDFALIQLSQTKDQRSMAGSLFIVQIGPMDPIITTTTSI